MANAVLERRVSSLEDALELLAYQSARTQEELALLSSEMREFKDEMREFKRDSERYREESRRENREFNRKLGEMSRRLGTMVEDLVTPSLPRIVREVLRQEVRDLYPRRSISLPDGRNCEFDAIAVTDDVVCLNSTKSRLKSKHLDEFPKEVARLREFVPAFRDMPVVGILAGLDVPENMLRPANRKGLILLGVGDELMEVKNPPGFEPKRW